MGNTEELIKDYIRKGGKILSVMRIDSYRSSGTKIIMMDREQTFYIDKDMNDLYYDYPLKTKVLDLGLQAMLLVALEKYFKNLEWGLKQTEEIINFLKEY